VLISTTRAGREVHNKRQAFVQYLCCSSYIQRMRFQFPHWQRHSKACVITENMSGLRTSTHTHTHTHTHTFNGPFSGTTRVSRYQKGKTNLDFTVSWHSEWQWHQLGHMHVCTSLQTDNHASTPPLSFLQAGCPSCHPTNSVKALKAQLS